MLIELHQHLYDIQQTPLSKELNILDHHNQTQTTCFYFKYLLHLDILRGNLCEHQAAGSRRSSPGQPGGNVKHSGAVES